MREREKLVAEVLSEYAPEVGSALWRLEECRERTLRLLRDMPVEVMDKESSGNSVGTVLYHVALIEADWLFVDVLGEELPAELAAWFPVDDRDESGILMVVRGESLDRHLERLDAVRRTLLDRFRGVSASGFHSVRSLKTYDVSPAWVLHHLAQHEAEHRGEIGSIIGAST